MVKTVARAGNVDQSLEDIVQSQLAAKRSERSKNRAGGANRRGSRGAVQAARRRNSAGAGKRRMSSPPPSGRGGGRNVFSVEGNGATKLNLFARGRRGESPPARRAAGEKTKLIVSNLEFGVSQKDMEELFGEFNSFSKAELHYNKEGRSLGTCELTFRSRDGAMKAVKQYKGVPLDGRAMEIEMLGEAAVQRSRPVGDRLGPAPRRRESVSSGSPRRARGGRGGRRRGGRGGGDSPKKELVGGMPPRNNEKRAEKKGLPTAEDLDKELDKYLAAGSSV